VAGDLAVVENLLPGTVSLHDYQLSPGDIRKISAADLIVVNGLGMEAFLDRALLNAGPDAGKKVVTLSDGLEHELIPFSTAAAQNRKSRFNPHIWLNPRLAIHCVTNLCARLQKADPANADGYARNAKAYVARLEALDAELTRNLSAVRKEGFMTYHGAFAYFANHYGLKLAGVIEKTPEVTPSAREMHQILSTIRQEQVKAIFTEPSSSPRLAQQIARDAGIRTAELDPLETGSLEAGAYESGLRRDCETLVKTLR
jgi:ABC-type Zn uptake system ZnuABC Zn-binding protein ZnuA